MAMRSERVGIRSGGQRDQASGAGLSQLRHKSATVVLVAAIGAGSGRGAKSGSDGGLHRLEGLQIAALLAGLEMAKVAVALIGQPHNLVSSSAGTLLRRSRLSLICSYMSAS